MEYRYSSGSCAQTSPPGTRGLLLVSRCLGAARTRAIFRYPASAGWSVDLTVIRNAIWEKQRFGRFNGITLEGVSNFLRILVYHEVLIKLVQ